MTRKSLPMAGSRPTGRISTVTMAKIPAVTEATASHWTSGGRAGAAEGAGSVVLEGMGPSW
ncbi:hypothetical protein RB200_24620 [Streptomyces sp. PmtG]